MKKILLVAFLSTICIVRLCSQSIKMDTLAYQTITDFRLDTTAFVRYNFVDRAKYYEGKNFRKLMDNLNIRPMIMGVGYSFGEDGSRLFSGIRLYIPSNGGSRCYIHVSWQEPQPMPFEAERLLKKYGMYKWLDEYLRLFAENRIGHIFVNLPKEID